MSKKILLAGVVLLRLRLLLPSLSPVVPPLVLPRAQWVAPSSAVRSGPPSAA